jgi:hypothetical protein
LQETAASIVGRGTETMFVRRALVGLLVVPALAAAALSARASAPPVGPLPKGPVTVIHVQQGLLFAIALPRPGSGLSWRGARSSDATIARPLDEGELNGNIVFTYRAGHTGTTTVVYALTRDESEKALQARYFKVVVVAAAAQATRRAARCSPNPQVAACYVVPPSPFVARVISVERHPLPAFEPAGGGPSFKRLYQVTFYAVKGNAILPSGHRYTQFAYVARTSTNARWCFLKGGSGP